MEKINWETDIIGKTASVDKKAEDTNVKERLEYLRKQIKNESISYGEIAELQDLKEFIEPGDVELLEWAGVSEFPEDEEDNKEASVDKKAEDTNVKERLEYLRKQIKNESISYGEIAELQDLKEFIEPGDVELLEWAGVSEFPEDEEDNKEASVKKAEGFEMKDISSVKTEGEARELAIDWQQWQSEQSLSYGELAEYNDYFEQLAKKFGLEDEFKENAII